MNAPPVKPPKSTSVISWLGFGMATALFLLIWVVNILVFSYARETANPIGMLYVLVILLGGILGLLAMTFSIIGLVMAIKNSSPKWMGVTGIVLCVLSLFSFFVPMVCADLIKNKTVEVEVPESTSGANDDVAEDVTIQIYCLGRVRCVNNVNAKNSIVGNMSTLDFDFNRQLANWLKMNNVDSSTGIVVNSTKNTDYSDILKVVDALNENGITKFRLSSTLSEMDYYN